MRNILGVDEFSWARAGVESSWLGPAVNILSAPYRSQENCIGGGVAQKWGIGVVVVVIGVNLSVPTGGLLFLLTNNG